jgi:hypothetical protein
MNAIDSIKATLQMSQSWFMPLIRDMQQSPLTFPTPNGGNHPLWVLGHVAYGEAELVDVFVKGQSNALADWEALFGTGSIPEADAGKYPSVDEILARFDQVRADTIRILESLTDDDLDKPSHAPGPAREMFGTIGQCFAALSLHMMFHGGQVADARRAARRKPVFM